MFLSTVVKKRKWKVMRMRNGVGTQAIKQEFSQLFQVLTNFRESYYNLIDTWRTCFLFLVENSMTKKRKQLVYFDSQNVNFLLLHHHILCQ